MATGVPLDELPPSVLYDVFQDSASVLTGLYLERERSASDPAEAADWGQGDRGAAFARSAPQQPRHLGQFVGGVPNKATRCRLIDISRADLRQRSAAICRME